MPDTDLLMPSSGTPPEESHTTLRLSAGDATARVLARLSSLAQRTSSGIVLTNAAHEIEWVNDAFCNLSGYSRAECIGQSTGALTHCVDDRRASGAANKYKRLLTHGHASPTSAPRDRG